MRLNIYNKMLSMKKTMLVLVLLICQTVYSQQDSVKPDTPQVYRNIETFARKNNFTCFLYSLVFKSVNCSTLKQIPCVQVRYPYCQAHGKIIRDIHIVVLDPFGYSVNDSDAVPQNTVSKIGNALHVQTRNLTINNILLIHKNMPFDSLLVNESERLIRSQSYVRDVLFVVVPLEKTGDSIDVDIRVLDKWSFIPGGAVSTARITAGFKEDNFAGLGHGLQFAHTWDYANGKKAFTANYYIPNIRNSYISAALRYNIDEYDNINKSLTIERPFYSPVARWAAGVDLSGQFRRDSFPDVSLGAVSQDLKSDTQDYWAGTENRIFFANTEEERFTNVVIASRYLRIRYQEKPAEVYDPFHSFADEDFYLFGIGLATRTYVKDHYIFDFGVTEDVPAGKVFGITGGYQLKNNSARMYLGSRISFGNYNNWGYLSSSYEYGTFFLGKKTQQGVFAASANYFSNLAGIGNWQIRQFIKPQITWGMNSFPNDSLTINNENGIRGFGSTVSGTKKIVLTLQTQSYAPWNLWGFRFGPYLVCSVGMLNNRTSGFANSQAYTMLGAGTLIRTDYLVLSGFQLSVAYYPVIPGAGYNIFKINAFATTDFGLRDFYLGKPEIVELR